MPDGLLCHLEFSFQVASTSEARYPGSAANRVHDFPISINRKFARDRRRHLEVVGELALAFWRDVGPLELWIQILVDRPAQVIEELGERRAVI